MKYKLSRLAFIIGGAQLGVNAHLIENIGYADTIFKIFLFSVGTLLILGSAFIESESCG